MAERTWWASLHGTLNSVWFLGLLHSKQFVVSNCLFFNARLSVVDNWGVLFSEKGNGCWSFEPFFLSASCSLQDMLSCQQLILSLVCAQDWISCQWHLLSIWISFWKLNVLLRGNIISVYDSLRVFKLRDSSWKWVKVFTAKCLKLT